ncbi:hypothetical protein GUITHDRAFT_108157 [Guillardia theta CCMP2712]|uniref:Phytanoyl-CoA dioxygenase n=1 Tax=Guillardia theta (strain CCMP2712) TaxID=905079 RepID=L1JC48_GUITC|nr:hypothetical protein GUITHDRAFT_108157 [Guillardia theta CCMP2712]EKX46123.1 hypothetical protein GUITHDRAFT_108157 [Guillardia theta CCMP2712]|eukprot:XP_005833103.1 hypothetical protein GUITHDRAFT_108157 [Guillardia theta CCMP2712]
MREDSDWFKHEGSSSQVEGFEEARLAASAVAEECQARPTFTNVDVHACLEFERQGHVGLRSLFAAGEVEGLKQAVVNRFQAEKFKAYTQKMRLFAEDDDDEELRKAAQNCRTEEDAEKLLKTWCEENDAVVPFLQAFNVHRGSSEDSEAIMSFVRDNSMGKIAAELMGVRGTMLYQTSIFYKEAGHGETSWHADLATSPWDTNAMITCWIPLTPIETLDDSPLEFASGSHRDVALPYWYTNEGMEDPSGDPREYDVHNHAPLQLGDCTWHHGWLFHAAPPNLGKQDRIALAVSFVSVDAHVLGSKKLRRRPEREDMESYSEWIGEVTPGSPARHHLLPIIYES